MLQLQTEKNYQSHSYQGKLEPDDGQWTRPAKDYASTRYSSLDQINTGNVKNLKLAFTFSTGMTRGHEAAPLIVNNTMYIVTPWPNKLYALDLTKPGAPMKWQYQPLPTPAAQGVACCDVVNRGASYDNGKIYYNTLDDQTVCVDANTGKEVWKTRVGDINKGESITMAPLVAKGKVLVGVSGLGLATLLGHSFVWRCCTWPACSACCDEARNCAHCPFSASPVAGSRSSSPWTPRCTRSASNSSGCT